MEERQLDLIIEIRKTHFAQTAFPQLKQITSHVATKPELCILAHDQEPKENKAILKRLYQDLKALWGEEKVSCPALDIKLGALELSSIEQLQRCNGIIVFCTETFKQAYDNTSSQFRAQFGMAFTQFARNGSVIIPFYLSNESYIFSFLTMFKPRLALDNEKDYQNGLFALLEVMVEEATLKQQIQEQKTNHLHFVKQCKGLSKDKQQTILTQLQNELAQRRQHEEETTYLAVRKLFEKQMQRERESSAVTRDWLGETKNPPNSNAPVTKKPQKVSKQETPAKREENNLSIASNPQVKQEDQLLAIKEQVSSLPEPFTTKPTAQAVGNKAVRWFLDIANGGKHDLTQFYSWYSTDILQYLTHSLPAHPDMFRYVFTSLDNDSEQAYYKQLVGLCYLSKTLQKAVCFIGVPSPINQNHFVFGLILDDSLLLINPTGITQQTDFAEVMQNVKRWGSLQHVYQATTKLQWDPEGLMSCGPLCVELMRHISCLPFRVLVKHFDAWKLQAATHVDITALLPESLKRLARGLEVKAYQAAIVQLRQQHLAYLRQAPYAADEAWDALTTPLEQLIVHELPPVNLTVKNAEYRVDRLENSTAYQRLFSKKRYFELFAAPALTEERQQAQEQALKDLLKDEPLLVTCLDFIGYTGLLLAILKGKTALARYLIECHAPTDGGLQLRYADALDCATQCNNQIVIKLLESVKPEMSNRSVVEKAIRSTGWPVFSPVNNQLPLTTNSQVNQHFMMILSALARSEVSQQDNYLAQLIALFTQLAIEEQIDLLDNLRNWGFAGVWADLPPQTVEDLSFRVEKALQENVQQTMSKPTTLSSAKISTHLSRKGLSDRGSLKPQDLANALPEDKAWGFGTAVDNGDCFYDAIAQAANILAANNTYSVESLRQYCSDYIHKIDKGPAQTNWVKQAIERDKGLDTYQDHLDTVQYTQAQMEKLRQEKNRFKGYAIWGRPHIEGRILTRLLKLTIHVIEFHEPESDIEVFEPVHLVVTEDSVKQVEETSIDYQNNQMIHLAVYRGHFVPILPLQHYSRANVTYLKKLMDFTETPDQSEKRDSLPAPHVNQQFILEEELEEQLAIAIEEIENQHLIQAITQIKSPQDFTAEQQAALLLISDLYEQVDVDTFKLPQSILISLNDFDKSIDNHYKTVFDYALNWNSFYAASHQQLAIVKLLLEQHGQSVNQLDKFGQTLLHKAAKAKDDALCAYLLSQKADPSIQDHYGQYAFMVTHPPVTTCTMLEIHKPYFALGVPFLRFYEKQSEIQQLLESQDIKNAWLYDIEHYPYINLEIDKKFPDIYLIIEFNKLPKESVANFRIKKIAGGLQTILSVSLVKIINRTKDTSLEHTNTLKAIIALGQTQHELFTQTKAFLHNTALVKLAHQIATIKPTEFTAEQQVALMQLGQRYFEIVPLKSRRENDKGIIYHLLTTDERKIIDYALNWNPFSCADNCSPDALIIMQQLIDQGINVNAQSNLYGDYCLHKAYLRHNWPMCVLLLKHGANPSLLDRFDSLAFKKADVIESKILKQKYQALPDDSTSLASIHSSPKLRHLLYEPQKLNKSREEENQIDSATIGKIDEKLLKKPGEMVAASDTMMPRIFHFLDSKTLMQIVPRVNKQWYALTRGLTDDLDQLEALLANYPDAFDKVVILYKLIKVKFKLYSERTEKQIKDAKISDILREYFDTARERLAKIEKMHPRFHTKYFDKRGLHDHLAHLIRLTKSDANQAKAEGSSHPDKISAATLFADLIYDYTRFLRVLGLEKAPPLPKRQPRWHEDRLLLEQQEWQGDQATQLAWNTYLQTLRKLARRNSWFIPSQVFITYAWSDEAHQKIEYWINPFLLQLRQDLRTAGIMAKLDRLDNKVGKSIYAYMEEGVRESDYVIVIGTGSLLVKHEAKTSAVVTELVLANRKQKVEGDVVFPLLLSGSFEESFPPYFELYSTIRDWQAFSYAYNLMVLLRDMFEVHPDEAKYKDAWQSFSSQLGHRALATKGLSEAEVKQRMADNRILKQKEVELATKEHETRRQQQLQEKVASHQKHEEALNQKAKGPKAFVENAQINKVIEVGKEAQFLVQALQKKYIAGPLAFLKRTYSDKTVPIEDGFINLAIIQQNKVKEVSKLYQAEEFCNNQLLHYEDIYSPIELINLAEIFDNKNDKSKHVLIVGLAGIGKSVFCQYVANRWAIDGIKELDSWSQQFRAVIWIPLRYFYNYEDDKQLTLAKVIYEQCFSEQKNSLTIEIIESQLDELEQAGQILYLLDGYDEVASLINHRTAVARVLRSLLQKKYWILTTRPYYLNSTDMHFDLCLQITGFTDENIDRYIKHFFEESDKANNLLDVLKANKGFRGICYSPIILELICSIYKEHNFITQVKPTTITDIYAKITIYFQQRFLKQKYSITEAVREKDIINHPVRQVTMDFLEKLAWQAMRSNTVILSPNLFISILDDSSQNKLDSFNFQAIFKEFGLLRGVNDQKVNWLEQNYYFIHLTFQEFFAACYIVRCLKENKQLMGDSLPLLFIEAQKDNINYFVVWKFIAGLLKEDLSLLRKFFDAIKSNSINLTEINLTELPTINSLKMQCLEECGATEELKFILGDVYPTISIDNQYAIYQFIIFLKEKKFELLRDKRQVINSAWHYLEFLAVDIKKTCIERIKNGVYKNILLSDINDRDKEEIAHYLSIALAEGIHIISNPSLKLAENTDQQKEDCEDNISAPLMTFLEEVKNQDWAKRISVIWALRELPNSELTEEVVQELITVIDKDPIVLVKGVAAWLLIERIKINSNQLNLTRLLTSSQYISLDKPIHYREEEIIYTLIQCSICEIAMIGLAYLTEWPIADSPRIITACFSLRNTGGTSSIKRSAEQAYHALERQQKQSIQQAEIALQRHEQLTFEVKNRHSKIYDTIKQFYLANVVVNLPIVESNHINFKELHFNLALTDSLLHKKEVLMPQEIITDISDLFKHEQQNSQVAEKIMIVGEAGSGKSTLCQSFAYQWANIRLEKNRTNRFDWVFLIPMRNLTAANYPSKQTNYSLADIIYQELLNKEQHESQLSGDENTIKKALEECLDKSTYRCLIILDGYNESQDEIMGIPNYLQPVIDKVITDRLYSVLVTTRPHFLGDKRFNRAYELKALSPPQVDTYIKNFMGSDDERANELLNIVKNQAYPYQLVNVPLSLMMLCGTWKLSYEKLANQEALTPFQVYDCFISHFVPEQMMRNALQQCAYESLGHGELIFNLQGTGYEWKTDWLDNIPFIKITQTEAMKEFIFLYQGVQEFLAAAYLAQNIVKEKDIIMRHKYDPRYQQVLAWVTAYLCQDTEKLAAYFEFLLADPKDIYGFYECLLFIKCIERCSAKLFEKLNNAPIIIDSILHWLQFGINNLEAVTADSNYKLLWETLLQYPAVSTIDKINLLINDTSTSNHPLAEIAKQVLVKELPNSISIENNKIENPVSYAASESSKVREQQVITTSIQPNINTFIPHKFSSFDKLKEYLLMKLNMDYLRQQTIELDKIQSALQQFRDQLKLEGITDIMKLDVNNKYLLIVQAGFNLLSNLIEQPTADVAKFYKIVIELIYMIVSTNVINNEALKTEALTSIKRLLAFPESSSVQRQLAEVSLWALSHMSNISLSQFLPSIIEKLKLENDNLDTVHMKTVFLRKLYSLAIIKQDTLIEILKCSMQHDIHDLTTYSNHPYSANIWKNLHYTALILGQWQVTPKIITIIIDCLSFPEMNSSNELHGPSIKMIANTDLAPLIRFLDIKAKAHLLENAQLFLKATTLHGLIESVLSKKDYKSYYPFIIELINLKKLPILEVEDANGQLEFKFFEDKKFYTYPINMFLEFFLKLQYSIKTINVESKKTEQTHSLIDWLHDELCYLEKENKFLDEVRTLQEEETIFLQEMIKVNIKSLPIERKQSIYSFFSANQQDDMISIIEELIKNQDKASDTEETLGWKRTN